MAVIFFVASFGTVTLDALGNIPFLRSVHPYERSEMTSVFRTYIEMSQLLPQAIYAGLLLMLPPGSVFVALGVLMIATAGIAGYLRSEEHTSELQSLMRISYAVFCLKKKNNTQNRYIITTNKCKQK